jgi:hypothetical protein
MNRLLVIVLLIGLVTGCDSPSSSVKRRGGSSVGGQSSREHLVAAMEYLFRSNEFDRHQTRLQVAYHLNRWLDEAPEAQPWEADPMTRTMPRAFRESPDIRELDRRRFQLDDSDYLQEAVWLQLISNWASRNPGQPDLEDWFKAQEDEMGPVASGQLAIAHRLFDWTVRNVQLDELLDYPADAVARPQQSPGGGSEAPLPPPPKRGIAGPGYQFYPWQTLLYGHGDALQRARVFLLLCRQQGIDGVMLAFPGKTSAPRPRPWLPAVLIGERLFLFDVALGLPIPGPEGRGVATLDQVLDDPQLFELLTVGDRFRYEVAASDLRSLLALIDASPSALSWRMRQLQSQLTGKYRTALAAAPTTIAEQMRKCRGVEDVAIWQLPFETTWYQSHREEVARDDPRVARDLFVNFGVFEIRNPLVRGRQLHFRGVFENQGEEKGAKALYMEARTPQSQIDRVDTSFEVQRQMGLVRNRDERDLAWRNRIASTKLLMSQAKQHATYWLGLSQVATGRRDSAIDWFVRRVIEGDVESPWHQGARYNAGRAFEAQGKIAEACQWYRADEESPQRHGNLLRANWLEQRAADASGQSAAAG